MTKFFGASPCRSGQVVGMPGSSMRVRRPASTAWRLVALGIVVAGLGCGGGRGGGRSPFVGQEDARITIEVVNHGFQDITLHAIWLGRRVRLGTVTGTRTGNFMMPLSYSVELQFRIDVLAGQSCTTRPIWTDPGDNILLQIRSGLRYCGY